MRNWATWSSSQRTEIHYWLRPQSLLTLLLPNWLRRAANAETVSRRRSLGAKLANRWRMPSPKVGGKIDLSCSQTFNPSFSECCSCTRAAANSSYCRNRGFSFFVSSADLHRLSDRRSVESCGEGNKRGELLITASRSHFGRML
jgi:hypothetical protein